MSTYGDCAWVSPTREESVGTGGTPGGITQSGERTVN